jgi:hypothetical protein
MAILRLEPIAPWEAHASWPAIVGRVAECGVAAGDLRSPGEWLERIQSKDAQLWLVRKGQNIVGVVITEIYDTRRGKTCAMPVTAADDMVAAIPVVLDVIGRWAREHDCKRLEGVGRKGWARALKAYGWQELATVVEARM